MAPEQMDLQQLAEAWSKADHERAHAEREHTESTNLLENCRREAARFEAALKNHVGQNVTHKLISVGDEYVLIEYCSSAHGPYTTVRRMRIEPK